MQYGARRALSWRHAICALVVALAAGCSSSKSSESADTLQTSANPEDNLTPVALTIAYGSEKKAWLEEAIQAFNRSPESKAQGLRITVTGNPAGSGEIVTEIIESGAQPHVFSPASDVYRIVLNRAWARKQSAAGGSAELAPPGKPLVLSPVVIAMWKPMAEALGWPNTPVGWADILKLATDSKGWASVGHPEWGRFKLGHTHPEYSNSGLLSVLAEAYAATGKTTGLTAAELADTKVLEFLRAIEGSIVHYGKSTGFFGDKMLERGPAYLSAAVLYENLIIDSYKRPEHQNRAMDVVAIYPKEGTFWTDNPYSVLEAPWVTAEHKKAADIFLAYLLSKPVQTRALEEYGFRPSDPSIATDTALRAELGVDAKQPKTLLDVPDAEVVDAALEAWKKSKKTVDIVFVFDRSGSMRGEPLAKAKEGARDFLSILDDRDRVSVAMFNHEVAAIANPTEIGPARAKLISQVNNTFADGGTALYDAVAAAHETLSRRAKTEPGRIMALVVLSDGVDENSKTSYSALQARLTPSAEQGVLVRLFTIAYGAGADKRILQSIAETGGGAFFSGDTSNIRQIYRDLAAFF